MVGRVLSVLLVCVTVFGAFGVKTLIDAGVFQAIHPHFDGMCVTYKNIAGPEDVEYSPRAHLLFISSDHRPEGTEDTPNGDIYALDLSISGAQPRKLDASISFDFHPHGMAIWDTAAGPRLWVINHRSDRTTVEVFDYIGGKLHLSKTIESPLLANANDLDAISENAFYVTSDHGTANKLLSALEDYSRIGRGYVSFYDGSTLSVKASHIRYANGIVFDRRTNTLFVASMLGRAILVYQAAPNHELALQKTIELGTAPDNLTLDSEGSIWAGTHPNLIALKNQSKNHSKHAPAQTLKIEHPLSDEPKIREIFMDDGSKISSSSVAFNLGHRLILGSVFDDRLLDCSIK